MNRAIQTWTMQGIKQQACEVRFGGRGVGKGGCYNVLSFEHSGCTPYSVGSRLIPPRWQRIALLWSPPAHFAYSACPTLAFIRPGGVFEGGFWLLQISDSLPHCALTALRLLTLRHVKKSGGVFHELPILMYKCSLKWSFRQCRRRGRAITNAHERFPEPALPSKALDN